jgi:hypothetical protein
MWYKHGGDLGNEFGYREYGLGDLKEEEKLGYGSDNHADNAEGAQNLKSASIFITAATT